MVKEGRGFIMRLTAQGGPKGGRPVVEESRGKVNVNHRGGT